MKFSDILALPYDPGSGSPSFEAVTAEIPHTPEEVVIQLYVDHGRNPDFQKQYSDLELGAIIWKKTRIPASELIVASKYGQFEPWFNSVAKRFAAFPEKGWAVIDSRRPIVEHWERNGSWAVAPVFLAGELVGRTGKLHLAEGHTRLATLAGAVERGLVRPESLHEIWLGVANDESLGT